MVWHPPTVVYDFTSLAPYLTFPLSFLAIQGYFAVPSAFFDALIHLFHLLPSTRYPRLRFHTAHINMQTSLSTTIAYFGHTF
jgi:hypothetical protein